MQDGAQRSDFPARDVGIFVDDNSCDRLLVAGALNAGLLFVDAEAFVLGDVPDPREQIAAFFRGFARA